MLTAYHIDKSSTGKIIEPILRRQKDISSPMWSVR